MPATPWTAEDTARSDAAWERYSREHDLTQREGQTAGIDPQSGRIWFGTSIADVIGQRDRSGIDRPLFFRRVGSRTYLRKGGRL